MRLCRRARRRRLNCARSRPRSDFRRFSGGYAERIEARAEAAGGDGAQAETALGKSPRLKDLELPRTTTQLRQAADAALEGSWRLATIDSKPNIRSQHAAIGPVWVIGPNNFPFAFNGISGGDFAAAIAAGNPVIAKAHPAHPSTTRMLAEEAFAAVGESQLPAATVQLLYHMSNDTGLRLAADERLGALAFTGSREGGLRLKAAADAAGKPVYVEMSSVNPLVILPGALRERGEKIADEFAGSALAGTGQFCTNPGFVVLLAGEESERFIAAVKQRFEAAVPACLLSAGVARSLKANVEALMGAGAKVVSGGTPQPGRGVSVCQYDIAGQWRGHFWAIRKRCNGKRSATRRCLSWRGTPRRRRRFWKSCRAI